MSPSQKYAVSEIRRLAQKGYELTAPSRLTVPEKELHNIFDSIRFQIEVIVQDYNKRSRC